MNGMMYIRGSRKDYDDWSTLGNNGWSYNEVLPYFLKSEDNKQIDMVDRGFHAVGGLLTVSQFPYHPPLSKAILKAGEELGFISKQTNWLNWNFYVFNFFLFLGHKVRDLNGYYHTGFAIAQTTNRNGSRLSTARAFLRPFKHRRNLQILLNATVSRVLINTSTKSAYGVEVLNNGQKQVIYSSKEVIISGGFN